MNPSPCCYCLTALVLVLASMARATDAGGWTVDAQNAAARAESGIEVRTYPETGFVYVEHTGPYWTLGRAIDKASAYIRAHGLSVPVVVRYAEVPNRRSTRAMHCRVGFFADAPHTPTLPFLLARLPEERAATLLIVGGVPDPDHDYEMLRRWIGDHQYAAAGPVTEVYPTSARPGDASSVTTEIRFTLRSQEEPVHASTQGATASAPSAADNAVAPNAAPLVADHVVEADDSTEVDDTNDSVAAPPSAPPVDGSDNGVVERADPDTARVPAVSHQGSHDSPLQNAFPSASHVASPLVGDEINRSAPPTGDDATLVERADERASSSDLVTSNQHLDPSGTTTPNADSNRWNLSDRANDAAGTAPLPASSVRQLFTAGRYADAVDAVLPESPPTSSEERRRLRQITNRLSAICRGIARLERVSIEARRALREFLHAFEDRSRGLAVQPTLTPPARATPDDLARLAAQEALLHDLDLAMVRITTGSMSAPAAMDSLMELLDRLEDLHSRNVASPSAESTP